MIKSVGPAYHLAVHATPGVRRTVVGGNHDDALRVSVKEPADKGKANKAIIKALAAAIGVSTGQIELIRGATQRRKTFVITDPPTDLPQRVAELASIS